MKIREGEIGEPHGIKMMEGGREEINDAMQRGPSKEEGGSAALKRGIEGGERSDDGALHCTPS